MNALLRAAQMTYHPTGISLKVYLKDKLICDLQTNSKFTLVDDYSCTGKTNLCGIVEAGRNAGYTIECGLPVLVMNRLTDISIDAKPHLILIDEHAHCIRDGLNVSYLEEFIKNSKHVFIIFSRDVVFGNTPYSVDDIKILRNFRGYIEFLDRYPKDLYKKAKGTYNNIFIEDSTTGLDFFKSIFRLVRSTNGAANYDVVLGREGSTLFIFDRCGFGNQMKNFYGCYVHEDNLSLLDYESFEHMLLEVYGGCTFTDYQTYNKEAFYEKELMTLMPQYGKVKDCDCFYSCKRCACCPASLELLSCRGMWERTKYSKYV